jgi:hypothetical protein
MSLSCFFTDTLGANLKNTRWSWGAVDPMMNRVFLRVWEDQVQPLENGEAVEVLRDVPKRKSNGYPERKEHLLQIANGAEGFGVVCKAVDPDTDDTRNISDFDKSTLLRFGSFVHQNGRTYAMIEGRIPASVIAHQRTSQSTLTQDIRSILKQKVEQTTKEALVNARVGQGKFRVQVLQLWQHRCCVTGSFVHDAIRASHIKPWSESTNEERLDPFNGLPLTANFDALFDAGLITFEDSGKLVVSSKLDEEEREIYSLHECSLSKAPSPETANYLAYHRASRFQE